MTSPSSGSLTGMYVESVDAGGWSRYMVLWMRHYMFGAGGGDSQIVAFEASGSLSSRRVAGDRISNTFSKPTYKVVDPAVGKFAIIRFKISSIPATKGKQQWCIHLLRCYLFIVTYIWHETNIALRLLPLTSLLLYLSFNDSLS
jgi:hypothetical protein